MMNGHPPGCQVQSGRLSPDLMVCGLRQKIIMRFSKQETVIGLSLLKMDSRSETPRKSNPGRAIAVKSLGPAAIPREQAARASQATEGGQSFGDCYSYACGSTRMQPLSHQGDHAQPGQPGTQPADARNSRVSASPSPFHTVLQDTETSRRHRGEQDWLSLAQRAARVKRRRRRRSISRRIHNPHLMRSI